MCHGITAIMIAFSVVVLAASLQVISSQNPDIPVQCRGPPPGVVKPHECCKIPPFFTPEDYEQCGFKKLDDAEGPIKHHGPPDCSKQLCIMDRYGLSDNGAVNQEAVAKLLDEYAKKNEAFTPTIEIAKERCLGKELPGPPHACEPNKIVFCISSTLFSECPVWEDTENCKVLKNHMDNCKQFFVQP